MERALFAVLCAACVISAVAGNTCVDKVSNCDAYGDDACTGVYEAWAKENCAKRCNFCGGMLVPPAPTPPLPAPGGVSSCVNKAPNCDAYGDSACTQYAAWAKENCAKMCNLCGGSSSGGGYPGNTGNTGSSSGIVITGQSSGCIYNGKTYKEGEKWNDACKYSCTCSDGVTGFYECNTMCPQWQLPDVCNLQPRPGKCCPKPSCPPNYSITYPDGMTESTLP